MIIVLKICLYNCANCLIIIFGSINWEELLNLKSKKMKENLQTEKLLSDICKDQHDISNNVITTVCFGTEPTIPITTKSISLVGK